MDFAGGDEAGQAAADPIGAELNPLEEEAEPGAGVAADQLQGASPCVYGGRLQGARGLVLMPSRDEPLAEPTPLSDIQKRSNAREDTRTDPVLTNLLQITGTLEYEEFGWSTVTSADWTGSDLILTVRVRVSTHEDQEYRVTCSRPRAHRILALAHDYLVEMCTEHVVLWPHNQSQGKLYFSGCRSDSRSLLGALIEAQRDAVGNWFAVDRFLNLPGRSADIFRGGHGLLAKGPVSLLEAFARVLDDYGVKHSSLHTRDPVWWNGDRWVPETEQLSALIIGESFVVAPSFAEKVL